MSKGYMSFRSIVDSLAGCRASALILQVCGLLLALCWVSNSGAQGILTVSPGRSLVTTVGTGTIGYTGDGGAAQSATLAHPSGIAYDGAGDLFLADANNDVVREISPSGGITTVAGAGVAGFGGDGGPATAAYLDTPTGVAVDASGNLYIADSHNHRIREVSGGKISTIAGNGVAGFAGDGGAATVAQLALPTGVAVDASGNVYVSDTNNQRIRKVAGGTITTIAGDGEELFSGDGGAATAASLDQPTGVAVDAAGNLYIADKNDQRVRVISTAGVISTLAGSGTPTFAGGFGGDGGSASAASLAGPVGVAVDSHGNVYVADTNNQRIRQVAGGSIATIAGTGDQGVDGDGGLATSAILNSPHAISADNSGNLSIADTLNQRLRLAALGLLSFGSQVVSTSSTAQFITLADSGTGPLTLAKVSVNGPFAIAAGGTCASTPISFVPGETCTVALVFQPSTAGNESGSVTFSGSGVAAQTVLLAGVATGQAPTTILLTESKVASLSGEVVTFTASLGPTSVSPTGSVTFFDGSSPLGSSALVNGTAQLMTTLLPDGPQTITAVYSGNATLAGATSAGLLEAVVDYSFGLGTLQGTVEPGHTVAVPFTVAGMNSAGLPAALAFTTAGLPTNLSVTFTPATASLNNGSLIFTMNVTAAPVTVSAAKAGTGLGVGGAMVALLLLPTLGCRRARLIKGLQPLSAALLFIAGAILLGSATGCGTNPGFFGQSQATYNVTINATATDATGGSLTHTGVVAITVQ